MPSYIRLHPRERDIRWRHPNLGRPISKEPVVLGEQSAKSGRRGSQKGHQEWESSRRAVIGFGLGWRGDCRWWRGWGGWDLERTGRMKAKGSAFNRNLLSSRCLCPRNLIQQSACGTTTRHDDSNQLDAIYRDGKRRYPIKWGFGNS